MISIKNIFIFISLTITISFIACEKEIEIPYPDYTPTLVLNAFITPDSLWEVYLHASQSKVANELPIAIETAEIEVFENGLSIAQLEHREDTYYVSKPNSTLPAVNKTYTIKVQAEGYPAIEATTSIPTPTPIDRILLTDSVAIDESGEYLTELRIRFKDTPNTQNFYYLNLVNFRTEQNDLWPAFFEFDQPAIEFKTTSNSGLKNKTFFSDLLFDGQFYEIVGTIPSRDFINQKNNFDELRITLATVNETYFNYFKQYEKQNSVQENPFAEAVFIDSNVQNGLGNFAGVSIDVKIIDI